MADISTLIFEELKREIATLVIKPGQIVDETEICKRYSLKGLLSGLSFSGFLM